MFKNAMVPSMHNNIPPLDMSVHELLAALGAIPEQHRDLAVNILVSLDGGEYHVPAIITDVAQFPATTRDPQPPPILSTLYAVEGVGAAAEIEALSRFQEFLDETGAA
jgi:hypothetical protein